MPYSARSIDGITAERWTPDLRFWVQFPADPKFQFFLSYYIKMDALFSNLMSIGTLDSRVPDSCANKIRGNSSILTLHYTAISGATCGQESKRAGSFY
jgi:hypothetical protein